MPTMSMERWAIFQCAHHLPLMPEGHKCRRVHGHTYKITIACRGPVGDDGTIFDNVHIDEVLMCITSALDHQNLNELGLPFSNNPTVENMLLWVRELVIRTKPVGDHLERIEIQEGDRSLFMLREDP